MMLGKGFADLFTAHIVLDTRYNERKFLIVECKAPGLETQDAVWTEASIQLRTYLSAIHGNHRKYGAIAIGKVVRFYEWTNDLIDFNGDDGIYYLDRQCQSISQKLEYFKKNH